MKEGKIEAIKMDVDALFKGILQIGYSDEGGLIYNSSFTDKGDILLLIEEFKYNLIRGVYDAEETQD